MVARWQCPKAWLPDDMINPDVHVCTCATIYHKEGIKGIHVLQDKFTCTLIAIE